MKTNASIITGEIFGTFLLVFFGCGSVAVTVLFDAHQGLFQIALLWGIGLSIAIYSVRSLSGAHFNPAVTLAMALCKKNKWSSVPLYVVSQFLGAIIAGLSVYVLFSSSILGVEDSTNIVRGSAESMAIAKMFGEYYSISGNSYVSIYLAMFAEAFGTFLLALLILFLTDTNNKGRPSDNLVPLMIGFALSCLIALFAPLTQACFNPARDFGPRIVAMLFGWGSAAFPDSNGGFLFVYILAPCIGGALASFVYTVLLKPIILQSVPTSKQETPEKQLFSIREDAV